MPIVCESLTTSDDPEIRKPGVKASWVSSCHSPSVSLAIICAACPCRSPVKPMNKNDPQPCGDTHTHCDAFPVHFNGLILWMDEIHFALPKKPWDDDSLVNTNKQWSPMVLIWRRTLSIHSSSPIFPATRNQGWPEPRIGLVTPLPPQTLSIRRL